MTPDEIKLPTPEQMPTQLYGLWAADGWVVDNRIQGRPLYVFTAESDALQVSVTHQRTFRIASIPVRIK